MLVVLDTNIIVSALLFNGPATAVHKAWVEGTLTLLFTSKILDEYRSVLSYHKFHLTADDVSWLMENEILPFGETIELMEPNPAWIPADPDDDVFIETTIRGNAVFLVSGDGHIFKKRNRLPCRIPTLAEFLTQQAEA